MLMNIANLTQPHPLFGYGSERRGKGYDPKIIKKVLAILKRDNDERLEEESVIDTYLRALGVFNTPPSD